MVIYSCEHENNWRVSFVIRAGDKGSSFSSMPLVELTLFDYESMYQRRMFCDYVGDSLTLPSLFAAPTRNHDLDRRFILVQSIGNCCYSLEDIGEDGLLYPLPI